MLGIVKLKKNELQPTTRVVYTSTTENYTSTGSDQTYESEGNDLGEKDGNNTKKAKQRLKPPNFTKIKEEESSSESGGSRESRESYETQESRDDEVNRFVSREELGDIACPKFREKLESRDDIESRASLGSGASLGSRASLDSRASLGSREELDSNESINSSRRDSLKSENSYKSGASRERTESVDEIDGETDESYSFKKWKIFRKMIKVAIKVRATQIMMAVFTAKRKLIALTFWKN
jgi:hypothetical protein